MSNILVGKTFGRLTVTEYAGTKAFGVGTFNLWKCRCECGKEKIIIQHNLVCHRTKSCGCLKRSKKKV